MGAILVGVFIAIVFLLIFIFIIEGNKEQHKNNKHKKVFIHYVEPRATIYNTNTIKLDKRSKNGR